MPFQKGSSGNPAGRPAGRRPWISDRERFIQSQKSFASLVRIRDGEILERKIIGKNEDGEPITADVVASIRDLIVANDKILNRTLGLPRVEGQAEADVHADRSVIFLEFLREWAVYLQAHDPGALEYMEIHIRGFAEKLKRNEEVLPIQPMREYIGHGQRGNGHE